MPALYTKIDQFAKKKPAITGLSDSKNPVSTSDILLAFLIFSFFIKFHFSCGALGDKKKRVASLIKNLHSINRCTMLI